MLAKLSLADAEALLWDWRFWARPNQLAPAGDWLVWLLMAGRGFGKTRSGSQWTHERAMAGTVDRWIALIGYDPDEVRDVMIEGPGGIMRNSPPWERPHYEPSKRRLTWPSGAWAKIFSSEDPEELRGFSGDTAWLDEPAKYKNLQDVWDNLMFGLREERVSTPRVCLTTTPKPKTLLKELLADPETVHTGGSSYDNRDNLDPKWYSRVLSKYEHTTLGQQEIYGRMLDEMPGALWKRQWITDARRGRKPPPLDRIVVAVDPPGVSGEGGAECGITVGGIRYEESALGRMTHGYILEDASLRGTPAQWGAKAVEKYYEWEADLMVGEANFGGEMVEHTIRTVTIETPDAQGALWRRKGQDVAFKVLHASKGKRRRAEPVSALYEKGRIHHCGTFADLEDQQCTWEQGDDDSPDRLDSLVWLLTELILGPEAITDVALPELRRGS